MATLKVIARRGASLLLKDGAGRSRILDTRHGRLFLSQSTDSALARGYWEDFGGDVGEVEAILATAVDYSWPTEEHGEESLRRDNGWDG